MKDNKILRKTTRYINNLHISGLEKQIYLKIVEKALEISDKEMRINYLYDEMCLFLDNEFKKRNLCGFCNKLCKRRKKLIEKGIYKETYDNGCCYSYLKKETCKFLGENGCTIKCLGCKIFTCLYLKKEEKTSYRVNSIPFAKYFFNIKQKFYIENTYFTKKDIMIREILKRG